MTLGVFLVVVFVSLAPIWVLAWMSYTAYRDRENMLREEATPLQGSTEPGNYGLHFYTPEEPKKKRGHPPAEAEPSSTGETPPPALPSPTGPSGLWWGEEWYSVDKWD